MDRVASLLEFLKTVERLQDVKRQVSWPDGRQENDAEHSWSVAFMAMLLAKEFPDADAERMLKLALMHDLVEIEAGDTYAFDEEGRKDKAQREAAAAKKLFGQLPADLEEEFHALFDEFEACETREARIVNSFDKLSTWVHNLSTGGASWHRLDLSLDTLHAYHGPAMEHDPLIEELYERMIAEVEGRKLL